MPPITNDDQIDYERVVADPEYRRLVIVYLNTHTDRRQAAALKGFAGAQRFDRVANQRLRRFG